MIAIIDMDAGNLKSVMSGLERVALHLALALSQRQAVEELRRAGETLEARVDAGLHAFFTFLREPCAARVLLLEVMGVSPDTDATYQRNLLEFGKQIMAIGQPAGRHEGEQASADARADQRIIGLALVGAMTNVGAAWLLTGYREPEEKMVRNCRRVLLGTLQSLATR